MIPFLHRRITISRAGFASPGSAPFAHKCRGSINPPACVFWVIFFSNKGAGLFLLVSPRPRFF